MGETFAGRGEVFVERRQMLIEVGQGSVSSGDQLTDQLGFVRFKLREDYGTNQADRSIGRRY